MAFFSYDIPCIVFCRGLIPEGNFLEIAKKHNVAVLSTQRKTSSITAEIIRVLNEELAPCISIHGVLVDVYGEGLLIMGESGIGKSETALELIRRGHRLVTDDVVEIRKINERTLIGTSPDITRYFIELRGIGIIDVKALYGDSITPQRCKQIYQILESNGFAINNVSLGVGSFSMQCLETLDGDAKQYAPYTRDTFGIAVKATYAEDADGNPIMIFKNPKTDTGHFKKSQRGCCRVYKNYPNGDYHYEDGLTWAEAQKDNELVTVFKNGSFIKQYTLDEVRQNLHRGRF